ncbi:hypothetical protein TRFO_23983 [Tritrichomonas foetus]|uniref:Uncharacterized protein n=1 Tax=Tritrichomonas foetus TaxID=1144522 RepID=A0A1J4K9T8_9EUKA|nr:hypothetical protein TRFO_23983 [Tritrichomonas foetus]|eukprot:OHT07714.1 hypothetical protein TRFO_23983 [Tritrichomonas foetus]
MLIFIQKDLQFLMSLEASLHVAKQHVNVTVQAEPLEIKGFTDIDITAATPHPPPVIFLNARQVVIDKITSGDKEISFQYIDSHAALLFKSGPLVRDASHFAAVSQIVNESPDLVIPHEGIYPVSLHIEFHVKSGATSIVNKNGIIFSDNRVDGPSGWFPCIDTIAQRSFFSLTVTFSANFVCVGPGESNLVAVDPQAKTNTMSYKIKYPVSASAIGFALGPFISQPLQAPSEQLRNDIIMYYIGSVDESFRNTLEPVPQMLQKITEKFSFEEPFYTTISFVSLPFLTETVLMPNVVFLPPSLNCPLGNVNIIYDVVIKLTEALIGLFIYYIFPVGDVRDQWLQHGIVSYFAEIFATSIYSDSFKLDRRWNDLNWLMTEDIFPSIVLYKIDPASGEPFRDQFLRVKAKLLLNMISTSMRNNGALQLVLLMRPLMKMCEEQTGFVTDRFFMDLVRFCPNINFKTFRQQWLYSNGFPIFTYNFTNDNRHNNMKLVLAQTPSCKTNVPFFTGNILVHLRDLEQPYEFQFAVENQIQLQQFNYFAHRRKTKTKKFTYVNGTETQVFVHHAVMWIILDHSMTWLCRVRPRLPEFMIIYQLDLLHNVFAQHEAISSLEDFKDTENTLTKLTEMLKDDKVFYGVRKHIARALAKFNSEQTEFKHMQILMDWYKSQFMQFNTQTQQYTAKPHDFHDTPRHFVQLEVIKSLSIIRDSQNYTPDIIVKLLIQILEQANNNSNNMYNDDYFNAEVILAFGRLRTESESYYNQTSSLIMTKLSLHASIPSYCNIITSAGYTALTAIALKTEAFSPDVKEMRSVVLEDTNYFDCRASVFRNLLFLCLVEKGVTFAELVSDVKTLCLHGNHEVAAMCLREVYRFILNSVHVGDQDHFQTYLLAIPEGMTNEQVKKFLTSGPRALDIVETLWEILTVYGQHHKILRSEALRAYTALYGEKLPAPYQQKSTPSQVPIDLTAERSSGSVVQIDITRSAQARNAQAAQHAAAQAKAQAAAAAAAQQQQQQTQQQAVTQASEGAGTDENTGKEVAGEQQQPLGSIKITLKKKTEN